MLTDLEGRSEQARNIADEEEQPQKQERGTDDTFCAFPDPDPNPDLGFLGCFDDDESEGSRHRSRTWIPYEAISYVWGEPLFTETLWTPEGFLSITKNLAEVLHQIRHKDKSRNLWADAVCINQKDLKEKGYQVKNMGQIYSKAEGVLIWLGVDSKLKAENTFSFFIVCHSEFATAFYPPLIDKSLFNKEMELFLKLPWFDRIWVVQEAILASHAIFLWGSAQLRAPIVKNLRDLGKSSQDRTPF
ncbi:het domain protein [Stagonosporopsis vannaccii]|nr:het domain protein [Stagonosporopsis vannaccii]